MNAFTTRISCDRPTLPRLLAAVLLASFSHAKVVLHTGFETNEEPPYPAAPGILIDNSSYRVLPVSPRNQNGTYRLTAATSNPFGTGQCLYLSGIVGNPSMSSYGQLRGHINLEARNLPAIATVTFHFYEPSGGAQAFNDKIWMGFAAGDFSSTAYIGWFLNNGVISVSGDHNTTKISGPAVNPVLQQDRIYTFWGLLNRSSIPKNLTIPGSTGTITLGPNQATLFIMDPITQEVFYYGIYGHTKQPSEVPLPYSFNFRSWEYGNVLYLDNLTIYDHLQTSPADPVQSDEWTGTEDDLWSNTANWRHGSAPVTEGLALTISASPENEQFNDLAPGYVHDSLTFDANAGEIFLHGNPMTLLTRLSLEAEGALAELQTGLILPEEIVVHTADFAEIQLLGEVSGGGGIHKTGPGSLILDAANRYTGGTSVESGYVEVHGDQTAANGGWNIGLVEAGNVEVTFASDAKIHIPAGKSFNIARPQGGGVNRLLNVDGEVVNDGPLWMGEDAWISLFDGATWRQNGPARLNSVWGWSARISVEAGATFLYNGPSTIVVNSGYDNASRGRFLLNGGTLVTNRGFQFVQTEAPLPGILSFDDGELVLSDNIAKLDDGMEVQIDSEARIDTAGYNGIFTTSLKGNGRLVKKGAGTLTLAAAPQYRADTAVEGGTLSLRAAGLDDNSPVAISKGAKLNLNFTGTDTIASLEIDGLAIPAGTYGAAELPEALSGRGKLVVSVGPRGFSSWAASHGLPAEPYLDTDGDGLTNGLEYALAGLHPTKPDGFPGILVGKTLTFHKNPDAVAAGDVHYTLETSNNLVDWERLDEGKTFEDDKVITASLTEQDASERVFVRLRVEVHLPAAG